MDRKLQYTICIFLTGLIFCTDVYPLCGGYLGDTGRNHHIENHLLTQPLTPNYGLMFTIPGTTSVPIEMTEKDAIPTARTVSIVSNSRAFFNSKQ